MRPISAPAVACCVLLSSLPLALGTAIIRPLTFISKFDDFPKTNLGALEPLPRPIYDELLFEGWRYKSDFPTPISESKPNYISFSPLAGTLGEIPAVTKITTQYTGSKVKSYALKSLYLACVAAGTGNVPPVGGVKPPAPGVAVPCTLRFLGTTAGGKAVEQDCEYSGFGTKSVAQKCVFDQEKFGNVTTVAVTVAKSLLLSPQLTAGAVDTVEHTNSYS